MSPAPCEELSEEERSVELVQSADAGHGAAHHRGHHLASHGLHTGHQSTLYNAVKENSEFLVEIKI